VEHGFNELEKQTLGRARLPEEACNGVIVGAYAVKALAR
jgi:hypothetical protein